MSRLAAPRSMRLHITLFMITLSYCGHGRRKDIFRGDSGFLQKDFLQGGGNSGKSLFYPLETKRKTFFY